MQPIRNCLKKTSTVPYAEHEKALARITELENEIAALKSSTQESTAAEPKSTKKKSE